MTEKDFLEMADPIWLEIINWIVNVQRNEKLDDVEKVEKLHEMINAELKKQHTKFEYKNAQANIEAIEAGAK